MSKHLIAVVLGALVLAVTGASFALARDGKPKRHGVRSSQTDVLAFTDRTVQDTDLDLGAQGLSQGDENVFIDDLLKNGAKVGTLGGSCTFVRVADPAATLHCAVTASLPEGHITVQGLIDVASEDDAGPFKLAVTGGTGAYRKARGEVTLQFVSEDTAEITVELIR